jgi:hypothetical protein
MSGLAGQKGNPPEKAKTAALTILSFANAVGGEVPILREVLQVANLITTAVEQSNSNDAKLANLLKVVERINPTVRRFEDYSVNDDILTKLEALKLSSLEIFQHVKKWNEKSYTKKLWNSKSYEGKFASDRDTMVACLDALDRSVTIDTNLGVREVRLALEDSSNLARETNLLLRELAPNLASAADSATALKRIREVIDKEHHDWDRLDSKIDGLMKVMKSRDAKDKRIESLESMEIDDDKVNFFEKDSKPEGIGRGTFGVVHRVLYERNIVAAKTIDLRSVPAAKLESTKREFQKEVALMSSFWESVRSPNLGCYNSPQRARYRYGVFREWKPPQCHRQPQGALVTL